ncbi:MAG: hypothetical protein DBY30_09210 [Verrucomicrobia bacterium]|nr:MAG: hypothetical protein DBY30_09210 [Verrucomicrobiota bacterium]
MGIFGAQSSVLKRGAPHVAQGPARGQKNCAKTSREARVELFDAAFQVNVSNVSATEYNAKKRIF